MLCPKCGLTNEAGSKFCMGCGAPLASKPSEDGKSEAGLDDKKREVEARAPRPPNKKASAVVPLLLVILVFAALGIALAKGWLTLPFLGESDSGNSLRVIPNQTISANIDNTGYVNFNAQTILADGGSPLRNYDWSLDLTSNPPSGVTIAALTGVVNRTGTSSTGLAVGTTSFKVKVSDGSVTKTGTVTLTVTGYTPGPAAVLQQLSSGFKLKDGEANKAYGASLFVMGGIPPYSWKVDGTYAGSADLARAGLAVDAASGTVRGTILNSASGKTITFKVVVTDSTGETAVYSPVYTIKIG